MASELRFEWDPAKDRANQRRHRISFAEAQTAFMDEHGRLMGDPDHSENEDRFILLGYSSSLRLLVVCHCYRKSDEVIRIISARKATRKESAEYAHWWKP